jgi:hypothetical protein
LRRGLYSDAASRLALMTPQSKSSQTWAQRSMAARKRLLFFLLAFLLLGLAGPLFAQSWRIANFEDVILVHADGSTLVKERIDLVFIGTWHGIHRTIPIEYPGPRGTNYTLFLNVTGVTARREP